MQAIRNSRNRFSANSIVLLFYILAFCVNNGYSQKYTSPPSENQGKSKEVEYFRSPSAWFQSKLDMMNKSKHKWNFIDTCTTGKHENIYRK